MPMDPLPIWKQELANIKPSKDASWAKKVADVVDQRVTSKLTVAGLTGQISYTFQKALFANLLPLAVPNPALPASVEPIVNAWQVAASASTIVVAPGTFIGAPTPPTLWSIVAASIILPPSVMAGASILRTMLLANVPVPDALASQLGPALFAAFSALQVSVTGIDSTPTPAGPLPLILPTAPVI